ncbi:polymer-forming cytoskeletal protein [Alphaproteobacteria bacterium]|nr:polymer-forming cytoskeletal protein [Alphaproteobacteria bacterium]
MDKSKAVIGADAKFVGTISNVKSIEIEGVVEADLKAEKLSIGASGKFVGEVNCDLVVIGGSYDGMMRAGSIWATQTAQIAGEIHYQSLQMDRGAALNCRVVHNWDNSITAADDAVTEAPANDEAETGGDEADAEKPAK